MSNESTTGAATPPEDALLATRDVTVDYGSRRALKETSLDFGAGTVTALIGPSGCGKSTYLRSINLMNREIEGCRIGGDVYYHGREVNNDQTDTYDLRKHIGMVFQQPNPFRKSVYENVAFAPRRHGLTDRARLDALVEESLRAVLRYLDDHGLNAVQFSTQIIIAPGYDFHIVSAMLTNFHQPQSTLLLLVSAFVGGRWREIYDHALAAGYRFLSYGDSSLLMRGNG